MLNGHGDIHPPNLIGGLVGHCHHHHAHVIHRPAVIHPDRLVEQKVGDFLSSGSCSSRKDSRVVEISKVCCD